MYDIGSPIIYKAYLLWRGLKNNIKNGSFLKCIFLSVVDLKPYTSKPSNLQ